MTLAMRALLQLIWVAVAVLLFACGTVLLSACSKEQPLQPRSLTFAELRVIRSGVVVAAPGERERAPYPRHRLVDGTRTELQAGGLVWLRRDDGTLYLVRGPAAFVFGAQQLAVTSGRYFASVPPGVVALLETPAGQLRLSDVQVSVELSKESSEVYVLRGQVQSSDGTRARQGERLVLGKGPPRVSPELAWQDWTGGLATTEQAPAAPPFGMGTVGARPPGEQGAARSPLAVQRLDVNVHIEGDFAVTEVDQVFFNPSSKTVEGIYQFRTPARAMLLRFGVDRGDRLVWGRVKERAAAAAQYAANVYEGSSEDPALLEWAGPGEYKARLYPIDPGATRRVVVRYSEWLPRTGVNAERRLYVYPIAAEGSEESLPHIEELTATFDLGKAGAKDVRTGMGGVRSGHKLVVRAQDWVPRADLAIELFDEGRKKLRAYRARHAPDLEALPSEERKAAQESAKKEPDYVLLPLNALDLKTPEGGIDLAIVVDTSAATEASSLALAAAATEALLLHLGPSDRAVVWTGADSLRPLVPSRNQLEAATEEYRAAAARRLATVQPGGATDLGTMLSAAGAALDPKRTGAVIYIGDGAPTVGELSLKNLSEKLARAARPFRIFAFGTGEGANLEVLDGIVNGGFAERLTDRYSAASAALRLLERVEQPTSLGLAVNLGGTVERVYPRGAAALTTDEGVLVVGRVVGKAPSTVQVTGPDLKQELTISVEQLSDQGDLRQRWAQGRLRELLNEGAGRAALVDLGMRYGIMTPVTSLYVPTAREAQAEADLDEALSELSKNDDNKEGGTGTRAKAEEGNARYAVRGPKDNAPGAAPPIAAAPPPPDQEAESKPKSGAAPAAQADAPVEASKSAPANMFGAAIGDSAGAGGLGLSGTGEGGGGREDGIGLGSVGLIGHGAGTGTGQGFGSGHGRLGGSHRTSAPKVRFGAFEVQGRLPVEVVQRIVRQNFGRFRLCYERGLAQNPNLEGQVVTNFVIDASGAVGPATNGASTLPDSGVIECVRSAFGGLSFPAPEGGSVRVACPIVFEPGGGSAVAEAPTAESEEVSSRSVRSANLVVVSALRARPARCGLSASLPLAERVILWRERLAQVQGNAQRIASVYRSALADCEAADWRSRARLFSLLLDAVPEVTAKVALWRALYDDLGARDVLYRGMLARIRDASEMRQLHDALGLRSIDDDALARLLAQAKNIAERVETLQALRREWPDDLALHLLLLDTLEDAERLDAARELAFELRARPAATTEVRTSVGEFYLRLAARPAADAAARRQAEDDLAEAKRSFGEIVEFAPQDPVARRRLGDLLRAHRWYDEARRQYETLAQLTPDDLSVGFLIAAAAEGQGRLEEALKWLEEAGGAGDPESVMGPVGVSRALAATYLAWGRKQARAEKNAKDLEILQTRAARILAQGVGERPSSKGSVRVSLVWNHPDFHPELWTDALGSAMPASLTDVALGIAQATFPLRDSNVIEVRIDEAQKARMARFGAEATLTVVFDEMLPSETVVQQLLRFKVDDPATLKFALRGNEVTRE